MDVGPRFTPAALTPPLQAAGWLDGVLRHQLGGRRVGFYLPAGGLGGSGDLASAWHLSRVLAGFGARVTIYTDATGPEALRPWAGTGVPGTTGLRLDGGRGPVSCPTTESGGVVWAAAGSALPRGAFAYPGLDLLVAVHDAPRATGAVNCPMVLVHEYGDHQTRFGRHFRGAPAVEYRTGFLAGGAQPGDVAGGIYLSRGFAGAGDAARDYLAGLTRVAAVEWLVERLRIRVERPRGSQLPRTLLNAESLSICYAGQRCGAGDFIVQWCRARSRARAPVLVVLRRDRDEVLEAVDASGMACRVVAVEPDGTVRQLRSAGGMSRGCVILLATGVAPADFPVLLTLADDVSLLTGDHSITEALAVATARAGRTPAILPIPLVGWYEKAEDYAEFLAAADARLAAAYLGWVLPRVDGTHTRTVRGVARSRLMLGSSLPPGPGYLFSASAVSALRAATRTFIPWLLASRAEVVSGRDAAFVPQSFPRTVAHLLCGHNIDDLRVA